MSLEIPTFALVENFIVFIGSLLMKILDLPNAFNILRSNFFSFGPRIKIGTNFFCIRY